MKSKKLKNSIEPHLTVIKNTKRKKNANKIHINTLILGFNYVNHLGKTITQINCSPL
jgi:hypothetical protein